MQLSSSEPLACRLKLLFKIALVVCVIFILCILLNQRWTYFPTLLTLRNETFISPKTTSERKLFWSVFNTTKYSNGTGRKEVNATGSLYYTTWGDVHASLAMTKQEQVILTMATVGQAVVNLPPTSRPMSCNSCFNHKFNYVIDNNKICHVSSQNDVVDLLVLVTTTHAHFEERKALRATWLTHARNNTANVRYVFLLGETNNLQLQNEVKGENEIFHDILKEDFVDSYANLTLKVIMGFKWAGTQCAHARHVMKTDDDMYVNIQNLLKALASVGTQQLQSTVIGMCMLVAQPHRNKNSKWYVSEMDYPEKQYPGFCSGTGYATSMAVVNSIYKISPDVPFFYLEDVYVALCIRRLGFTLKPYPGFYNDLQYVNPCIYKGPDLITSHGVSPKSLLQVWQKKCGA